MLPTATFYSHPHNVFFITYFVLRKIHKIRMYSELWNFYLFNAAISQLMKRVILPRAELVHGTWSLRAESEQLLLADRRRVAQHIRPSQCSVPAASAFPVTQRNGMRRRAVRTVVNKRAVTSEALARIACFNVPMSVVALLSNGPS